MHALKHLLLVVAISSGAGAAELGPPKLTSATPLGGTPDGSFEAVLLGEHLEGATDLWSPSIGLQGEVVGVDRDNDTETDLLDVRFLLGARLVSGAHDVRVITAHGLSNALRLIVHAAPSVLEQAAAHDLAIDAQRVPVPSVVHGKIAEVGEVDFYSFSVQAGDELVFRTFSSATLDPGLAVFDLTGSWFDAHRARRLAFADEPVEYPGEPVEAMLRYRFDRAGDYLIRVNGFWGHGGEDQSYALLINSDPDGRLESLAVEEAPRWTERTWRRPLDADRMEQLAGRTILSGAPSSMAVVDADAEVRSLPVETPAIQLPALIKGTIERPGDFDRVRFTVEEGDRLVFEIQTPQKSLPQFNPLLRIFDSDGVEAFTNIWSRVDSNGNVSKQIYPKTEYVFPRAGEFTLEIRDITVTYGDAEMEYRVIVRPWVPHLGEGRLDSDYVNLVAGKAQELSVVVDQEEGYDGLAAFSLEGLPAGVDFVTGATVEPEPPPALNAGKKERFTTNSRKVTFVLMPATDAPLTPRPTEVEVYARPVVDGEVGARILMGKVLAMVVADTAPVAEEGDGEAAR